MTADGRFVRVYYEDLKRDHLAIFDDDELLVSWLRLAILADKQWPDHPELPARLSKRAVKALADAGLLVIESHCFTIKGMDAIRQSDVARTTKARQQLQSRHPAGMTQRRRQHRKHSPSTDDVTSDVTDAVTETVTDAVTDDVTETATATRDKSEEVAHSSVFADAQTEERATARAPDVKVDWSHEDQELQRRELRHPEQLELQKLAETLTGQPYAMANVYGGLGAKAVTEQLEPFGFARVKETWTKVAERVSVNGRHATLRQLVLGADNMLNAVPSATRSQGEKEAEAQASFDRRVERTKREMAHLRGEPA